MTVPVTGLIAKQEALEKIAKEYSFSSPITLAQGFALLPLSDEMLGRVVPILDESIDGFNYLCPALIQVFESLSFNSSILYFETEYFGGAGGQGAVVFCNNHIALPPEFAEYGPINKALSYIGIVVNPECHDEFETIGLNQYRSTEKWLLSSER